MPTQLTIWFIWHQQIERLPIFNKKRRYRKEYKEEGLQPICLGSCVIYFLYSSGLFVKHIASDESNILGVENMLPQNMWIEYKFSVEAVSNLWEQSSSPPPPPSSWNRLVYYWSPGFQMWKFDYFIHVWPFCAHTHTHTHHISFKCFLI